ADTDNRVVDVLWKLVAECLSDFFVRLASKTIGSSVTRDIRYGFEIPYDDVAGHVRCLCLSSGNIEFFVEISQLTLELEKTPLLPISVDGDTKRHEFSARPSKELIISPSIGILAFGSLIDNPGEEIEAALVGRKLNVRTPFSVEFARSSIKRRGAPTLAPVQQGGGPVLAQILLVNVPEQEAKDRLWRRETNRIGQGGHYADPANPGPNTLVIDRYENFEAVEVVLAARFAATIVPLTAARLAELAIESARLERTGRDGITYLMDVKRNGITTRLSDAYEREILRRTQAQDLGEALQKIQAKA
ncbi:MAG: hypothetical protein WB689_18640, partial [Xanthobacteraceae bacterium]